LGNLISLSLLLYISFHQDANYYLFGPFVEDQIVCVQRWVVVVVVVVVVVDNDDGMMFWMLI
jgi:hypothetical protein